MNYFYKILFFITFIFAFDLELDSKMPKQTLALLNIDGQELTLNDIKGDKGTVIIFSSNTCPWVIRWEDRYVKIANKYRDKGVNIIAVNSNSARFNGSENVSKLLDVLGKKMTPSQIEKAQDLARECVKKDYKGC